MDDNPAASAPDPTPAALRAENAGLRARLEEAEEALNAIREGRVDAVMLPDASGTHLVNVNAADQTYRALVEAMSEGAATLNADGVVLYANRRLAQMLRTPLDRLIGSRLSERATADSRAPFDALVLPARRDNARAEVWFSAGDGTRVPVYVSASHLTLKGIGQVEALVLTDLTEQKRNADSRAADKQARMALLSLVEDQKRISDALADTKARLDGVLASIAEVIWSVDARTHQVLYINPAAEAVFGRTVQEFLDSPQLWLETTHPDDVPIATEMDRRLREEGHATADFRIQRPDGSVRWIRDAAILVRDASGNPLRVDGIVSDITERRTAEQALVESEAQFRGLVEQSIAGLYIIQDGKLVYVNPRFAEIAGHDSPDDLAGRDVLTLIAESDHATVKENIRRRLSGETSSVSYGFSLVRRDGSTVDVGVHGAVATYRGRPAIIGLMQDISEKKRAEAQIQRYIAQLETAFMRTVEVATTISEMRDPYTAGHEKRVAEIAVAIGIELGFDARRLEGLRVAGHLHDIGKITIPSEILAKPGKLSAAEFTLIKGHAEAGYDVLKGVDFPWPVAQVALQHHERIDGSGYPRGLKGEEILLEARVMAVADVVEAMSSHRPYRAGLGIDKALAEIERGRGTAYDPRIADACLTLFREKGYAVPA